MPALAAPPVLQVLPAPPALEETRKPKVSLAIAQASPHVADPIAFKMNLWTLRIWIACGVGIVIFDVIYHAINRMVLR